MTAKELDILIDILTREARPEVPTVAGSRAEMKRFSEFLPTPRDLVREPVDAGGVAAEIFAAPGADAGRTVLYLHGGGYIMGDSEAYRVLAYDLSKAAGARVVVPNYRLAPEHPFPAAVEDAQAAWRWLLATGAAPERTAVAGDSAGGGLAVATLVALRRTGDPLPAAAVCISPWVDMEGLGESVRELAARDVMVQPGTLLHFAELYLNGADPRTPLAAPLYAELAGLPPLLIQVGGGEILRDDSRRLAARARAAGVEVTLEEWPEMIHVWHLFAHMLSEGREAIQKAGAFIRERIA